MDDQRKALKEATRAYIEFFGFGPPTFGVEVSEAITRIHQAIRDGRPWDEVPRDLPPDAYL